MAEVRGMGRGLGAILSGSRPISDTPDSSESNSGVGNRNGDNVDSGIKGVNGTNGVHGTNKTNNAVNAANSGDGSREEGGLQSPTEGFLNLALDKITPNPDQPRRVFEENALVSLADSIKERGLVQPILVRPYEEGLYQIVAGERRWRAAGLAGLQSIPTVISEHTDAESLEVGLIENMVRQDLTPVEEARACAILVEEFSLTREDVGRRVGRSRVAVSNLLRLLDLPEDVLELLNNGDLTEGHGRALLLAPDHQDRRRLAKAASAQGWTVRQTEQKAKATLNADVSTNANINGRRAGTSSAIAEVGSDQLEAADSLSQRLSTSLGCEVSVIPDGAGFRVALVFESLAAGLAVADSLELTDN